MYVFFVTESSIEMREAWSEWSMEHLINWKREDLQISTFLLTLIVCNHNDEDVRYVGSKNIILGVPPENVLVIVTRLRLLSFTSESLP